MAIVHAKTGPSKPTIIRLRFLFYDCSLDNASISTIAYDRCLFKVKTYDFFQSYKTASKSLLLQYFLLHFHIMVVLTI